jgi:hypothetical protein
VRGDDEESARALRGHLRHVTEVGRELAALTTVEAHLDEGPGASAMGKKDDGLARHGGLSLAELDAGANLRAEGHPREGAGTRHDEAAAAHEPNREARVLAPPEGTRENT